MRCYTFFECSKHWPDKCPAPPRGNTPITPPSCNTGVAHGAIGFALRVADARIGKLYKIEKQETGINDSLHLLMQGYCFILVMHGRKENLQ